MGSDNETQNPAPGCTPCQIRKYLAWLEETDAESLVLYERARFQGIMARIIHGKFAVLSSGRPGRRLTTTRPALAEVASRFIAEVIYSALTKAPIVDRAAR